MLCHAVDPVLRDTGISTVSFNKRSVCSTAERLQQTCNFVVYCIQYAFGILLVRPHQNERLDEENRVRLKEESRQARLREKRKEEAKNDIIIQVHRVSVLNKHKCMRWRVHKECSAPMRIQKHSATWSSNHRLPVDSMTVPSGNKSIIPTVGYVGAKLPHCQVFPIWYISCYF